MENGGVDFVILCTNTMHKVADEIQANIGIPLLHIVDATAQKITSLGLKKIGLLGTRFTMEEDFHKGRLINKHGLEVIIPNSPEREIVHRVIIELLVHDEDSQVLLFDTAKIHSVAAVEYALGKIGIRIGIENSVVLPQIAYNITNWCGTCSFFLDKP